MPLRDLLDTYVPFDAVESENLTRLRDFLHGASPHFGREVISSAAIPGHITLTGWIVDRTRTQTLLTYHAKTDEWLPPGEHCDENADVAGMALTIAQQITGLPLAPLGSGIFDVNIRIVPEYWNTPEHWHYELCFAMQADAGAQPAAPTRKIRWVTLEEVHTFNEDSALARLVAKTLAYIA